MMDQVPFVDFYDKLGFAPTRQASGDTERYLSSRRYLYRQLGLPDVAMQGLDIAEFGPGSGENAIRILQLDPRSYTFFDGSTPVLAEVEKLLTGAKVDEDVALRFVHTEFSSMEVEDGFDLVICEGVLPFQLAPRETAASIYAQVRSGGVVVVTCMDAISGFSEVCRRYIAHLTFALSDFSRETVDNLVAFFSPDFDALEGMTRRREDWVIDSILNPWLGDFFSMRDALEVGDCRFALLGSSPRIFQDWRWYKDPTALDIASSSVGAMAAYDRMCHNFLDMRFVTETGEEVASGKILQEICGRIAHRVRGHISENLPYDPSAFAGDVAALRKAARHLPAPTLASLTSLEDWAASGQAADLTDFRGLWGRGQQYISLTRL